MGLIILSVYIVTFQMLLFTQQFFQSPHNYCQLPVTVVYIVKLYTINRVHGSFLAS